MATIARRTTAGAATHGSVRSPIGQTRPRAGTLEARIIGRAWAVVESLDRQACDDRSS